MAVRSRSYAYYVLALFTAVNFVNYVDRMVIVSLYDSLRARFHFSDGQLGAFAGAFFAVHALTTIPLAYVADRVNRKWVLGLGVLGWSAATLGTAWAWGFLAMLFFRALVGVGEASYLPAATSILCETFRPEEKARTMAIFNVGMFAGACVGIAGGSFWGFPLSFEIVAYPGFFLGVLILALDVPARRVDVPREKLGSIVRVFSDGLRAINVRTLRWMLISGVLISFAVGGYISWFVDFVIKFKGLDRHTATIVYGLIALTGGVAGVLTGGMLGDRLQKRTPRGRVLTVAIGFVCAVPFALIAIFSGGGWVSYASSWLLMFFIPWYNGPMVSVIDDLVEDKEASRAQASFSMVLHLCGTAPGGFLTGVLAQAIGLRYALVMPTVFTLMAAGFAWAASNFAEADLATARTLRNLTRATPAAA